MLKKNWGQMHRVN